MRPIAFLSIVASIYLVSFGCNWQTPPAQGVAVIDLDDIARRLGRDLQMQQAIQAKEAILNEELASMQSFYRRDYDQAKQTFGDQPTPEQTQTLREKMQRMNTELQKVQTKSQQELNQLSSGLIRRFREEVLPVARKVASEAGMNLVVTKNDTVIFSVDSEADITDRVVEQMLAARPVAPPAFSQPPSVSQAAPVPSPQPPIVSQQTPPPSQPAARVSNQPAARVSNQPPADSFQQR